MNEKEKKLNHENVYSITIKKIEDHSVCDADWCKYFQSGDKETLLVFRLFDNLTKEKIDKLAELIDGRMGVDLIKILNDDHLKH